MIEFFLKEIHLISFSEKKAKSVEFARTKNVIIGSNGTGKSCLIKSIYRTFGATPTQIHPNWINAEVSSLVKYHFKGKDYSILKYGNIYGLFDSDNQLLNSFESVTKELAPFLAKKFNFSIRLSDRQGKPSTLPPAYFFLPFYVDQDSGWKSNWSSFEKLGQFGSWRTPVIEYHTGIKGNDYYETKLAIDKIKKEIKEFDEDVKVIKRVLKDLREKLKQTEFNIDIEAFQAEVQKLVEECQIINNNQNEFRIKILEFTNIRLSLVNQINITKTALKDIQHDYSYAVEELAGEAIECPTCGTLHDNSFADRLSIANDEHRCYELLQELNNDFFNINTKIQEEKRKLSLVEKELSSLKKILNTKKGKIKLKDIIDSQGRSEMRKLFKEQIDNLNKLIYQKAVKEQELSKKLKGLTSKERKAEIEIFYQTLMKKYLTQLEVLGLKEKSYSKVTSSIKETGSALPRALTAYYYSMLQTVKRYSSSTFCPIIIDSPNQQGQDAINLPKIIRFINDNQPEDSQLILGLEDFSGVDFDGKVIELKNKGSLLQEEYFEKNLNLFRPYINAVSEIKGGLF
jgi:predicted  nucleic acid-binding Zn-ribbon protein